MIGNVETRTLTLGLRHRVDRQEARVLDDLHVDRDAGELERGLVDPREARGVVPERGARIGRGDDRAARERHIEAGVDLVGVSGQRDRGQNNAPISAMALALRMGAILVEKCHGLWRKISAFNSRIRGCTDRPQNHENTATCVRFSSSASGCSW